MTGLITNYINAGTAASRPATPSVTAGSFGLYYATDTGVASIYAAGAWAPITASGVAWGSITGTLSTQSDLNTALAAKVATSTTVTAGTGMTGGGTLASGVTLNLANTAVTAGSYTFTSLTVDAQGRITAATNGPTFGTSASGIVPASGGGTVNYLRADGSWAAPPGATSGTVTSVALSLPAIFSVSGSPVTSSGTLTATLATQTANTVFAGPSSGSAAAPTFRALTSTDVPPSQQTVSSSATVTPTFTNDIVTVTAQAAALALANPTGTAVDGWGIVIRVKDNGTARAITFDTQYRALGVTLPTTTTISKWTYISMIYNSTDTKWDVVGVLTQA